VPKKHELELLVYDYRTDFFVARLKGYRREEILVSSVRSLRVLTLIEVILVLICRFVVNMGVESVHFVGAVHDIVLVRSRA
jgi:hypothetical protein